MPGIVAALLLAAAAAVPALAQQAATANALAAADAPPERTPAWAQRLSLTAREALPGAARGSVDLGLQWRQPIGGKQVDITAWRRMAPPPDALALIEQQSEAVYGARVEMKLAPASKKLFAHKFIGMQLDSGARIGIRKSNGNPTLYYRNEF